MVFGRRKRCVVVIGLLLWLLAVVLLKLWSFAPKDETRELSDVQLRHRAIALTERKAAGTPKETLDDRIAIKIDSENAHAQEKLNTKKLEDEKEGLGKNKYLTKANNQRKEIIEKREVEGKVAISDHISDVNINKSNGGKSVKKQTQQDKRRKRRFPHIIIIGAGKAGTRVVYEMIQMHPAVRGPLKEMRYFDRNFNLGIQWYMKMMPETYAWQKTIEKSPDYIISRVTPPRLLTAMKQFNRTHMKFVLVVRDPFVRAVSEYMEWKIQRTRVKAAMPPFHKMVLNKHGEVNINCPPVNTSAYSYHLDHWLKYFSIKDFCFVSGETIVTNPYHEMKQLERCLGLKSSLVKDNFVYIPQRGFYCLNKKDGILCMDKSKGRTHPEVENSVEKKLRAFYAPFNQRLYKIAGRNFGWT